QRDSRDIEAFGVPSGSVVQRHAGEVSLDVAGNPVGKVLVVPAGPFARQADPGKCRSARERYEKEADCNACHQLKVSVGRIGQPNPSDFRWIVCIRIRCSSGFRPGLPVTVTMSPYLSVSLVTPWPPSCAAPPHSTAHRCIWPFSSFASTWTK